MHHASPIVSLGTDSARAAFTLIELSMVLVIIGLLVGGILVGQDLLKAAAVRGQVSQIEQFYTAVNTFRIKYDGYLPGDIPEPTASAIGFTPRGHYAGEGDGNGVIEGAPYDAPDENSGTWLAGETGLFWSDLAYANLVPGNFLANPMPNPVWYDAVPSSVISSSFPAARIGRGNVVFVWSGGWNNDGPPGQNAHNYFGMEVITLLGNCTIYGSKPGLTAAEAAAIDAKIDDGLPLTGKVQPMFVGLWAGGGGGVHYSSGALSGGPAPYAASPTGNNAASSSSCFDNNGNSSNPTTYTLGQNNSNLNCTLSFQF